MNKDVERIKKSHHIAMLCMGINEKDTATEEAIVNVERDLEILDILAKYDVLSVISPDMTDDYEKVKWYLATHKKLDL